MEYQEKLNKYNIIALESYKNNRTKIKHKCTVCNTEFTNSPYNILVNNKGCIYCHNNDKYKEKIKPFKLTILENYVNNITPIKHKCLQCNSIFIKEPSYILNNKYKCPNCKDRVDIQSKIKALDPTYTVLSDFINTKTKIKIRHEVCGLEYEVTPANFIYRNRRCPKCSKRLRKTTDIEEII